MPEDSSTSETPSPQSVPLAIRRVLHLSVVIGVVLAVWGAGHGVRMMGGAFDLFGLGMVLLAAVPPAIAVFFARYLLRKAPTLAPIPLGVRVGALLSYTTVVAALYATTLLDEAVWLDAQAGLAYMALPLATLAIGLISSGCGAVTGGLIAKLKTS